MRHDPEPVSATQGRGAAASPKARFVPRPLRHWRVPTKLAALLAIPVFGIGVAVVGQVGNTADQLRATAEGERTSALAAKAAAYIHELQCERLLLTRAVGTPTGRDPGLVSGQTPRPTGDLVGQRKRVDRARSAYYAAASKVSDPALADTVRRVRRAQDELDVVRADPTRWGGQRADSVVGAYTSVIAGLVEIGQQADASADADLVAMARSASALAQVKELLATKHVLLLGVTRAPVSAGDLRQIADIDRRYAEAVDRFRALAEPSAYRRLDRVLASTEGTSSGVLARTAVERGAGSSFAVDADRWTDLVGVVLMDLREAEKPLVDAVATRAQELRSGAVAGAIGTGVVVALVVLLAIVVTTMVSRSLVVPLRTLRTAALDAALRDLPEAVERLRHPSSAGKPPVVPAVQVYTDDELGEVARAFEAVHRQAVLLAGEQAALRRNVSATFIAMSRRSQVLVERQLQLIDKLERGEADPRQLSALYRLDHLATRMRRNDESLLVLAGVEPSRRPDGPMPLTDLLSAATAEIEHFSRVEIHADRGIQVADRAARDVVHLVAELLENATRFSAPHTRVRVIGSTVGPDGGALVTIEDEGIGLTSRAMTQVNERLVAPATVDVAASGTMGLYVVGRLADRHRVRVQLRAGDTGGTTALIRLPVEIVEIPDPDAVTDDTARVRRGPRGPRRALLRQTVGNAESPPPSVVPESAAGAPPESPVSPEPSVRPVPAGALAATSFAARSRMASSTGEWTDRLLGGVLAAEPPDVKLGSEDPLFHDGVLGNELRRNQMFGGTSVRPGSVPIGPGGSRSPLAGSSVSRWVPSPGRRAVGPTGGARGGPAGAAGPASNEDPRARRAEMLRARLRRLTEGTVQGRSDDLESPRGFGEDG